MSDGLSAQDLLDMARACERARRLMEIEQACHPSTARGPLNCAYVDLHVARDALHRAAAGVERYLSDRRALPRAPAIAREE